VKVFEGEDKPVMFYAVEMGVHWRNTKREVKQIKLYLLQYC